MSAVEELKNLRAKREELSKEITKKATVLFKEASSTLFVEYPNLVSFGWTQYTPYFNDGDTCEFGSRHDSPFIKFTSSENSEDEDDLDYEDEFSTYHYYNYNKSYKVKTLKPELTEAQLKEVETGNAVVAFLKNFDDSDMLHMFGDHQKVIVTAKKVESEDYDHD